MKHMESARRNIKSSGSLIRQEIELGRSAKRFVLCVRNKGYAASLEVRKIYRAFPDEQAAKVGHIRVIDESGEDYLYPSEYFLPIKLPQSAERAMLKAGA